MRHKDSIISNDLGSVLREPVKSVSVGIRPSGNLHIGNLVTMTLAGLAAAKANAEVHLTICDIDMPNPKPGEKRTSAMYFKYQKVGDTTRSELAASQVHEYTSALANQLGIPVRIDFLSDIQKAANYRQGLSQLLEKREDLVEMFTGMRNPRDLAVPVYPVCGSCNHTPIERALNIAKETLKTRCRNSECDKYNQTRAVNLFNPEEELGVHYYIDPIRDVMFKPRADLHVFGGDYLKLHGNMSKVEKVCKITELTGEQPPNYLLGPLLVGPGREKISKSEGSRLTLQQLSSAYKGQLPQRITAFTEEALKSGRACIPHEEVMEYFKTAYSRQNHPPSGDSSELSPVSS